MKILIHSDEYFPTAQACSYRMQVFVDKFIELGNEVTVITSSANKNNATITAKDYATHKERILYSPAIKMRKKTTLFRLLNNLSFSITSVFSAIRAGAADVVITTSPPPLVSLSGWLIAKCKRARLVYDVRDIWPDVALEMGKLQDNGIMYKCFRSITRFMYKQADAITTVSSGKVTKIQNYVAACSGKKAGPEHINKVILVGNGFDETVTLNPFDQSIVDKYHLDEKPTCVYIGNIGLAQGLDALLDVARNTKHKDIQFLLFGMGAEKETLENKAKENGLTNVVFCGIIDHSKVFSVLSRSKISFISLKSSNMKDSVPTKIYEALGIGCPVLLVAEGESCCIVNESQLGVCISPDSTENLPDTFDSMIDRYDQIAVHREEATKLMHDKYSRQKIAEQFEGYLKTLCDIKC